MIEYQQRERSHLENVPVKVECDVCGANATGRRFGGEMLSSKFFRCQRNSAESPVSETAMINETVVTHEADLCERCATDVAGYVNDLSFARDGRGMREAQ